MAEPEIDRLLEHEAWIRAFASRLVRDPGLADDIVQETWVTALKRGPRDDRSLQGWLATRLRGHLRHALRSERRRAARQVEYAQKPVDPSDDRETERAETLHRVVRAVLHLDEPFRSAIHMRYVEQLAPPEIARRTGVPVATVHSRLARGLARLRAQFHAEKDTESPSWLAWLEVRRVDSVIRIALARVRWRATLGASAILGAIVGSVALVDSGVSSNTVRSWVVDDFDPAHVDDELTSTDMEIGGARRPALDWRSAALPPNSDSHVLGRVLDRNGGPVAGVAVSIEEERKSRSDPPPLAISGPDGRFRIARTGGRAVLRARDERYSNVLVGLATPTRTSELAIVVAPAIRIAGRVSTRAGAPIAGVTISSWIDPNLPIATEMPLDHCRPEILTATTDHFGRFRIDGLPVLPEARLAILHPNFKSQSMRIPHASDTRFEITLDSPTDARVVSGTVRDASGAAVPGALVSACPARTIADDEGDFELVLWPTPAGRTITAVAPEHGAVQREIPVNDSGTVLWPQSLDFVLPREMETIHGNVRDPSGKPIGGAVVWLANPTRLGEFAGGPAFAESMYGNDPALPWPSVTTDEFGAFRLDGLFSRAYRLRIADPRTLACAEVGGRAGDVLAIELPSDGEVHSITGQVVDSEGIGMPGVAIRVERPIYEESATLKVYARFLSLPIASTGVDGRFTLPPCSTAGTIIRLDSDEIVPVTCALADLDVQRELRLVVSARAYVRAEVAAPHDRADTFELIDADGNRLALTEQRDGCSHHFRRAVIANGRSLVFSVPATLVTAVFLKSEKEVHRVPLRLAPREVLVVRW